MHYPPYSVEVFHLLASLIGDGPRVVLDIGCGTGELARPLAAFVGEVDAVDPSAAMIEVGRDREGGDVPSIRWVCQSAEEFPAAIGLDAPQLESIAALCGALRPADSLADSLRDYSWIETDAVVSAVFTHDQVHISVNLLTLGPMPFYWSDTRRCCPMCPQNESAT